MNVQKTASMTAAWQSLSLLTAVYRLCLRDTGCLNSLLDSLFTQSFFYFYINQVTTELENLEYSGISQNAEPQGIIVRILCNIGEKL